MRLLKTTMSEEGKFEVELFMDDQLRDLRYAILSHTWGSDEVTLQDINDPIGKSRMGYKKIEDCCSMARKMEYQYIWIDTCCIDKTSSAELSEAINSMFLWYQEASVCYAYLFDVPGTPFEKSRWFTRGWTLQELIAPQNVIFFDERWRELGDKKSLGRRISECTRIPESVLSGEKDIDMFSTAQRMSWAAERQTSRIEDRAYCLMGLFGVNMPLIYGEREAAFIRLQQEILRISEDHSLFAWKSSDTCSGLLATSPYAFIDSHDIVPCETFDTFNSPLIISGKGIHLDLCFIGLEQVGLGLAVLQCRKIDGGNTLVAIFVHDSSLALERFNRIHCDEFLHIDLKRYRRYQYRMLRMCIQAGRMAHFQAPKDSEGYNSFSSIQIYPKSNPIRTINWHSSKANVDLWLLIVQGNLEAVLNMVSQSRTPLSWAAENGLEKYVAVLLKRGAATEMTNKWMETPLSLASRNGHTAVAKLLLDNGASTRASGLYDRTPLTCAILADKPSIIKILLDKGANIDAEDRYRRTPLVFAVRANNVSIVKMLLNNGAKIETKSHYGYTPLAYAVIDGNISIIKILLDLGANIDTKDRFGYTPLVYAISDDKVSIVETLLNHGAKINIKDQYGYSPLIHAILGKKVTMIKILLDKGVDMNQADKDGRTALIHAIDAKDRTIVMMLLEKGVDIEAGTKYGLTPLMLAIAHSAKASTQPPEGAHIVEMLILHGADINAKDLDGKTPLLIARSIGHEQIVNLLLEKGAVAETKRQTAIARLARKSQQVISKFFKSQP